jgi:hypothetical protein
MHKRVMFDQLLPLSGFLASSVFILAVALTSIR